MATAVFLTVAVIHLLVWSRVRSEHSHLLFAATAAAAAANAIAETFMYRANSLEAMATALRWYVNTSGLWAILLVWFVVSYSRVGRVGYGIAITISGVLLVGLFINAFSPASFLYSELTGLREITLPWGERCWLAVGKDNPLRSVIDVAFIAMLIVVADGCYQCWIRAQRVRALLLGFVVVAFASFFGVHAFLVDTGRLDSPYLSTYSFLAMVGLMSYELAGEVLQKAKLSSELLRKESALRSAVADERVRIAGDLHDSVTQTLFSTAAIADALPDVWERQPEEARDALEDLKRLARGALAEMRSLLLELRPTALLETTLGQLLQQLASATAGRTQMPVSISVEGDRRLPDDVQITLYRVAQEAIHNAVKHAQATIVDVHLVCSEHDVALTIRDDGCGFDDNDAKSGMGLDIMRDRMRVAGALLKINSTPDQGTTISAVWVEQNRKGTGDAF